MPAIRRVLFIFKRLFYFAFYATLFVKRGEHDNRIILHCDCNCFYASCELLSHPDLRQLPVAVCGDPTERHGIILAKNEPAKRCGVKTAETIWKAKQKCPGLILLPPHHRLYAEYSKKSMPSTASTLT